ncbi:MAG: hypothetical protein M1448_00715 [Candidatus Marsarchaeota archaeon]|jgi:hypothetical protein|nr:hypothetical protein [Candidatus Marsarchaeota archaeon]
MRENRCIVCGKARDGLPVADDMVIETIRALKKRFAKKTSNYRLTVCKEDYPKYSKMRETFEKRRATYLILGAVFAIVLVISSLSPWSVVFGAFIILLMYLLSLLSYAPGLEARKQQKGKR